MSTSYKFKNLLGTVYSGGNVEFYPNEDVLASPVGNRISLFDLKNNKSVTLPLTTKSNIKCMSFSPDASTAILVDESQEVYIVSLISRSIVHRKYFRADVTFVKFSPDGKKFAICTENRILIYHTPGKVKCVNPFTLNRSYYGPYDDVTCIDWTDDSQVFLAGSRDMCTRVYAATKLKQLIVYNLGGNKSEIVRSFFECNSMDVYSISNEGRLCYWKCDTELNELTEGEPPSSESEEVVQYKLEGKHFYNKPGERDRVMSANFFKPRHILVTGFESGAFLIHELPAFNLIHSLKVSDHLISTLSFNCNGDWIAVGSSVVGELMIWEWQSESYVLKQRGHFNNMTSMDFSTDGQYIATGGTDGKVKIWNTLSGFCFVTFTEHSAEVSQVAFTSNGHVVVSASLDGTVRAFDLHRYRNFRTLTSPRPAQLMSLAVEPTGEFIAAGSQDTFEIYVWSMQTGRLLDVLSGHDAPVVTLSFSCDTILVSGSWDKTVKLWNVITSEAAQESIQINHQVCAVCFHPDGTEFAVSQSNAEITFWNAERASQIGSIECRSDIIQGKSDLDKISAASRAQGNSFHSISYSANGDMLLAGGSSLNICLYSTKQYLLMKRFQVTRNLSFDAVSEFVDRRKTSEFGAQALVDMGEMSEGQKIKLPGTRKGNMAQRAYRPDVRVTNVKFSPSGMEWAATTTEGLVMFSIDSDMDFHPFDLEMDVTPKTIRQKVQDKEYSIALLMAFRLNESNLTTEVIESIPVDHVPLIVKNMPLFYAEKLLSFVGQRLSDSNHTHFYMIWCQSILFHHTFHFKKNINSVKSVLHLLHKNCIRKTNELGKICDDNKYQLQYIKSLSNHLCNKKIRVDDEIECD